MLVGIKDDACRDRTAHGRRPYRKMDILSLIYWTLFQGRPGEDARGKATHFFHGQVTLIADACETSCFFNDS
jgi:hypothetical protein